MFADDPAESNLNIQLDRIIIERKNTALLFLVNKMGVKNSKTKFIIFHTRGKRTDKNIIFLYKDNEPDQFDPLLLMN